jgi:hypothetical protein
MSNKLIFLIPVFFLVVSSGICSQEALKSSEEEYYDFLALEGAVQRPTLGYRTLSDSVWTIPDNAEGNIWSENNLGTKKNITEHISYKLFGPDWYNSFNTAAPYGQNDGALWQGKGYNSSLTAGARLEAYGFEITLKPQVCFSQNLDFEIMTSAYENKYGYFWNTGGSIDLPQRFGDSAFFTFDWGDTEIRYTWKTLTIGFGTQSPWLGPAWLNPMLGSNNAATYPKLDLGIRKTSLYMPWLGWYIGDIEARLWTGMLTESDYFDTDSSNDHNMLNALSFSYAPSFVPGLTLGLNRVFLTKWNWENLKYIGRLFTFSTGNAEEDQKVSFTADWLFTKVGLEIYGELGIDDYANSSTIFDYIRYPFHTMDYTIGLKKTIPLVPKYNIRGEIIFEWNDFEMSQDFQLQWEYMGLYSHSQITQGYTNRGQILGAGSGSMGNSQYLGFSVYYPKGKATLYVHRTNPDNNYIYSKAVYASAAGRVLEANYFSAFEATFTVGISNKYFFTNAFSLLTGFAYELLINPRYEYTKENNFIIQAGLKYNF